MTYFYDTNILLNCNLDSLEKPFYLSSVTLQELENIKTSGKKTEEIKFKARKATRWLQDNEDKYVCVPRTNSTDEYCEILNVDYEVPDNQIMSCAKALEKIKKDLIFVTNDLSCYNIAKQIFNLKTERFLQESDDYRGYKEITLNTEEFNSLYEQYSKLENPLNLIENEYLIIKNNSTKDNCFVYRNKELKLLKLPKGIKGLNSKQNCALDLLNNPNIPIKVLAGTYGSGKSYLAVRTGIYHLKEKGTYTKLMFVRNPVGAGQEVGYLPGDLDDKTTDFFSPFVDNINGGEQELENMKRRGELETQIPFYLKGRSIPYTYIIVDEAEDLTIKDFKLIGSRIANGSAIVFTGDFKQAETKYLHSNGLSNFIQYIKDHPNPLVGVMILDDDVRSNASKYFIDFE